MARHQIVPRLEDRAGNSLRDGEVRIYEAGTLNVVDVYDAAAGGVALAHPLSTDAQGSVEVWSSYAGEVDVIYSDGGNTVDARDRRRPFPTFTETRRIGPIHDVVVSGLTGVAYQFDPDLGTLFDVTLDANCVFSVAPAPQGTTIVAQITQVGGFTFTWPGAPDIVWPSAIIPNASVAAGSIDIFVLLSLSPGAWAGMTAAANLT